MARSASRYQEALASTSSTWRAGSVPSARVRSTGSAANWAKNSVAKKAVRSSLVGS